MGITSTISLAAHARAQLNAAAEACDLSGVALERAIAVLDTSDDLDGPLVTTRQAIAAWRDELNSVGAELAELSADLGRFAGELQAIQQRLSPAIRQQSSSN